MSLSTIRLKENIFLTTSRNLPEKSTKILASSLPFMSGGECAWYLDESLLVINNTDGLTEQDIKYKQGVIAKPLFVDAVQRITPKGMNSKDTKFVIYSQD